MVKPLTFKGDKKQKKRKRPDADKPSRDADAESSVQNTNPEAADNDDSWVSADAATDISGPIMIVLPTETPSALACDPSGAIFVLPIENIVDGHLDTTEPHDVRQVWVANRVAGTESFRLKGHHGRYLSCDKIGALSATSEAVSPLESFNIVATNGNPGSFDIQTLRDTFLTIKPTKSKAGGSTGFEVRGDGEESSTTTTFLVRMQARFKPKLRASKEEKAQSKISRRDLEEAVGRRLDEDEVRKLKRARREGDYHERLLELKVKGKHDKYG
ncbi:FRG1-like family-domain-containing protein [Thelonectria olida]|uniref:FRG1-like family-domain-containing protein n=1 Tax=Thelonectria olida TaxID=1576542 RepID=A0A9P8WJA2_9HYPO|nr:FRG1-like family-domain-containing protein [Thelonectria olida]